MERKKRENGREISIQDYWNAFHLPSDLNLLISDARRLRTERASTWGVPLLPDDERADACGLALERSITVFRYEVN